MLGAKTDALTPLLMYFVIPDIKLLTPKIYGLENINNEKLFMPEMMAS